MAVMRALLFAAAVAALCAAAPPAARALGGDSGTDPNAAACKAGREYQTACNLCYSGREATPNFATRLRRAFPQTPPELMFCLVGPPGDRRWEPSDGKGDASGASGASWTWEKLFRLYATGSR
jgi:hypothetical protein